MNGHFFQSVGSIKAGELAERIGVAIQGDKDKLICGVATLQNATEQHITFFSNNKYKPQLKETRAGACIMHAEYIAACGDKVVKLVADDPYVAYARVVDVLYPDHLYYGEVNAVGEAQYIVGNDTFITPSAVIQDGAEIGDGCKIMPGVYIGRNVKIGNNCIIGVNAVITNTVMGNNCVIHNGVCVGQEGFGFASEGNSIIKVKQIGGVIIGDNVEIGSNSCIDRGAIENTIIGHGTKLDNLVQIGHNVQIGSNCIIVAQAAVAGSTTVGNGVVIGGQAGVAGHLNIGDMAKIAAKSGVMRDIEARAIVGGSPAIAIRDWHKQSAVLNKIIKRSKNYE